MNELLTAVKAAVGTFIDEREGYARTVKAYTQTRSDMDTQRETSNNATLELAFAFGRAVDDGAFGDDAPKDALLGLHVTRQGAKVYVVKREDDDGAAIPEDKLKSRAKERANDYLDAWALEQRNTATTVLPDTVAGRKELMKQARKNVDDDATPAQLKSAVTAVRDTFTRSHNTMHRESQKSGRKAPSTRDVVNATCKAFGGKDLQAHTKQRDAHQREQARKADAQDNGAAQERLVIHLDGLCKAIEDGATLADAALDMIAGSMSEHQRASMSAALLEYDTPAMVQARQRSA